LAEQRAVLAEKMRIQEFQERFLAILGHDLRNPLASIDMGLGILREQTTDVSATRVLSRMQSSSARMTRMIGQILDLTRSRLAGGLELDLRSMDLQEVLQSIVDELRVAYPSHVIDLHCPPARILGDSDRLAQVFSNLVGNAILHGDPSTPITVRTRIENDLVTVTVHNDGEPIPAEIQAKLFDPFRRGERESRTASTSGLGLGLYISWEIVRGHGGSIELEPSGDSGTTFRVCIPIHPSTQP